MVDAVRSSASSSAYALRSPAARQAQGAPAPTASRQTTPPRQAQPPRTDNSIRLSAIGVSTVEDGAGFTRALAAAGSQPATATQSTQTPASSSAAENPSGTSQANTSPTTDDTMRVLAMRRQETDLTNAVVQLQAQLSRLDLGSTQAEESAGAQQQMARAEIENAQHQVRQDLARVRMEQIVESSSVVAQAVTSSATTQNVQLVQLMAGLASAA